MKKKIRILINFYLIQILLKIILFLFLHVDLDAEKNINYSSGTIEWVPAANVYTIKTDNQIRREKDSYEVSSGCKNHCNIAISSNNDIKNNNCIMTNTVNTKCR